MRKFKDMEMNSDWASYSSTDPIDLRLEMDAIFDGGLGVGPSGYWVIYRHYDRNKKSKYYSRFTDEGVGGPPYEYTEYLVKTYRVPVGRRITEGEDEAPIGTVPTNEFIYYFKVEDLDLEILPENDMIYEIEDANIKPADIRYAKRIERYRVKSYQRYRQVGGRIEYYAVYAVIDISSEDDRRL